MRIRPFLLGAVLVACEPGTGGKLTTVSFELEVASPLSASLEDGALIELSSALLSFGPVYVFEAPPPTARSWWRTASEALVSSASAHPGHDFFSGGRVMTEWLEPRVLELSAPRHQLGRVPAIAGPARSMAVHLLRDADNANNALRIAGTLTRDGLARPFSLDIALAGAFDDQRVDFVPVELLLDEDRVVTVVVEPRAWFRGARFEETVLEPIDPRSQTGLAVQINLRRFSAFGARTEASVR